VDNPALPSAPAVPAVVDANQPQSHPDGDVAGHNATATTTSGVPAAPSSAVISSISSVLAPSGVPTGVTNSTPDASGVGENGTNSTGGAEPYARVTMPIAGLLAVAGAVGAMVL
jgi:hypothetical protein